MANYNNYNNNYNPNNQGYNPGNQGYNPYNNGGQMPNPGNDPFTPGPSGRSRGVAALLAIFLGGLGIQYFYCGRTTAGILAIVLTLVTCGIFEVVWLIQGIMMLAAMSQQEFERKFVYTNSTFPLF